MDLSKISEHQLELAIKFWEIIKVEDLAEAASILASFDWSIPVTFPQCRGPLALSTSMGLPANQTNNKISPNPSKRKKKDQSIRERN